MIPILLPLAPTDVTVRVAAEQSALAGITDAGASSLATGGEAALQTRTSGAESAYGIDARGLYGRMWTPFGGANAPADTLSASLSGDGTWHLAPLLHLSIRAEGYLANRFGVRATDALASRDPFLFGPRLEYTTGGEASLSMVVSPRVSAYLDAGYLQSGGLAAVRPDAVGVDTHEPHASVGIAYEIGPRDTLTPEVRYAYTHFYHALYDVDLHRGPADIHAVTATVRETRAFSRRITGSIGAGITVATPPPILASRTIVTRPEARAQLSAISHKLRFTAAYTYGFASLGPRVGFGSRHTGAIEITYRPVGGAAYRDLLVHGIVSASFGAAPVAENPPLHTAAMPVQAAIGTVSTTAVAAGARVEYPLRRGLAVVGGLDVSIGRGVFDPAPPTGQAGTQVLTVATVGIAGTFSTDPGRTVKRDPEEEDDEARRRESANALGQAPGSDDLVAPAAQPIEPFSDRAPR